MTAADNIISRDSAYVDNALRYNTEEHPIALQLGGADPGALAAAARIAVNDYGYDAINLNCGCPSPTVSGVHAAGASHMLDAAHTARCCAAIAAAVPATPVTVKCRTGVSFVAGAGTERRRGVETYAGLRSFVERVAGDGGVHRFVVHARPALLGAGTIENRHVPPLDRPSVHRLAADLPHLSFVLNGAVADPAAAAALLSPAADAGGGGGESGGGGRIHGVMAGRAVVNHPWAWSRVDVVLHGCAAPPPAAATRGAALAAYTRYAEAQAAERAAGGGGGAGGDAEFARQVAVAV
jgi:tRNA-dihydrouridine synthase A